MKDKRYSIIYSSKTGNTKKLAETIYNILSQDECDYYGTLDNIGNELSKTIYLGFWTEKGNADSSTLRFLEQLKDKKYSYLELQDMEKVKNILKTFLIM